MRYRAALVALTLVLGVVAAAQPAAAAPNTVIVSTSGVPHRDVGNLSQSPFWSTGDPQGINGSWRRAFDATLSEMMRSNPRAVLHQGDMFEGNWGIDVTGLGLLGPVTTFDQRKRAVTLAADLYYGQMRWRWAQHGARVHAGLGDHEIGGIPNSGLLPRDRAWSSFRYRAHHVWRRGWAATWTNSGRRYGMRPRNTSKEATAYAVLEGDIGIVTIDPFVKWNDAIHARASSSQLRWIGRILRRLKQRGARWLVVQSEIPALHGVEYRVGHSSQTLLENGDRLWRILRRRGVHLLLTAEFHAITAHSNGGRTPVQITHGGVLSAAHANWLVIRSHDNRLRVVSKSLRGQVTQPNPPLWATSDRAPPNQLEMPDRADTLGALTVRRRGAVVGRSGILTEGVN